MTTPNDEHEKPTQKVSLPNQESDEDCLHYLWVVLTILVSVPVLMGLIVWLGIWAALVFPLAFAVIAVGLHLLLGYIQERPWDCLFVLLIALAVGGLMASGIVDKIKNNTVSPQNRAAKDP